MPLFFSFLEVSTTCHRLVTSIINFKGGGVTNNDYSCNCCGWLFSIITHLNLMKLIDSLVVDMPEYQHTIIIEAFIKSAWESHRDNLDIIRDTRNPLRSDAIKELMDAKQLATDAIDRNLINNPMVLTTAKMLSNLDIQRSVALSSPSIARSTIVSA